MVIDYFTTQLRIDLVQLLSVTDGDHNTVLEAIPNCFPRLSSRKCTG